MMGNFVVLKFLKEDENSWKETREQEENGRKNKQDENGEKNSHSTRSNE